MFKCTCTRTASAVAVAGLIGAASLASAETAETKKDAKFVPQAQPVVCLEQALYGAEEIERILTDLKTVQSVVATNDECVDATPLDLGEPAAGSTSDATPDPGAGTTCGTSITAPGVWYSVSGTGNTMTASLCNGTFYDSKLSVFCGSCTSLTCVGGNDDFCGTQSQLSWCSEAGSTYYVLVHGFSSSTGDFEILVTDDGVPCMGAVECEPIGGGGNDLCADAIDLGSLPASTTGSTTGATVDPVPGGSCGTTVTAPGVWYSFVGTGTNVTASLCAGTDYDSKLSIFSGSCANLVCEGGNDDACGLQSEVTICASAGVTYYVLVHGFSSNTGDFTLDVFDDGVSCECETVCEPGDTPEGEPVCFDEYDDVFNGGCNSTSPVFSDIQCGDVICGTSGNFLFTDPVFGLSEFRDTDWYRFTLATAQEVTFSATTNFPGLIGIVDTGGVDDCLLVTDFLDSTFTDPCIESSLTATLPAGTWYLFVAPADFTGVACGSEYRASLECAALPTGACCLAGLCTDGLAQVDCESTGGLYQGDQTACDDLSCPVPPPNDDCADAIGPLDVPSTTPGTTTLATIDLCDEPDIFCTDCGTIVTSPGVWYTVIGTGNTMTASLCNGTAAYDTKLSVYCGDCDAPLCIDGNDDSCGLQSEVSWCSQFGAEYLILVHGFGGQTGDFDLELYDDGTPCGNAIGCLPEGACCVDTGCIQTTEIGCDALGGSYNGDDTACPATGYVLDTCGEGFEDISGTGNELFLGDDDGVVVPLGFDFDFYGDTKTDVGVGSNGYLTFGADLTDFSNDPIPDSNDPNDLIAVLWDDLSPDDGGTVHYQTLGTAPNRRFIAQWTDVPQFFNDDANTFQAVLYEGSNEVQLRYGDFTPEGFSGDYTMGIENADGSDGIALDAATVVPGDCYSFMFDSGNTPPSCTTDVVVTIWPPNHMAVEIDVAALAGATDSDLCDIVSYTVTSITQDEPINGLGDGNTTCDAGWTGTTAYVRAERQGGGNGRVYRINYEACDLAGECCSGYITVEVPHSQNGSPAVDDGQNYDSTPCFGKTDVNADGVVNTVDMEIVVNNYGAEGPDIYLNWPDGDVNGDACTDVQDLVLVMQHLSDAGDVPYQPAITESDSPLSPVGQMPMSPIGQMPAQ